jgi:hypothetical protein
VNAAIGGLLQDHRCFETPHSQGWVVAGAGLAKLAACCGLWRPEDGKRVALPLPDMEENFPGQEMQI